MTAHTNSNRSGGGEASGKFGSSSSPPPRDMAPSPSPLQPPPLPPPPPSPPALADRVFLAPMVRGSELATRMFLRDLHGPRRRPVCYGPMLRAAEVADARSAVWEGRFRSDGGAFRALSARDREGLRGAVREDAYLALLDTSPDDSPLVAQLCGRDPPVLAAAASALVEMYDALGNPLHGIDLNLGCPQACAQEGGFGAFLAEEDPDGAVRCVRAMREAVDAAASRRRGTAGKPRLSAKIRLQSTVADTVSFARRLRDAGCELLAVHCRRREDEHDGEPDYDAGAAIVRALQERPQDGASMPVVINGDVRSAEDARRILERTGAHAVMAARGFLENPRMLLPRNAAEDGHDDDLRFDPAFLAAEYLTYAERYPPPSPLYIRKHLRWIFRRELQPPRTNFNDPNHSSAQVDYSDWRPRLWTFLVRPYLETAEQFRGVVALYVRLSGMTRMPPSLEGIEDPSFKSIRKGKKKKTCQEWEFREGTGKGVKRVQSECR